MDGHDPKCATFRALPARHAVSPQQLADVVDLAGAHARQVHVDQGFLDALLAPPVAFDHRGLEQGALEFRHLQLEPAGLGGELAFVVAGPVRLPSPRCARIWRPR